MRREHAREIGIMGSATTKVLSSVPGSAMTRVAVLTPDPADASHGELWPKVLARLQRALDVVGIDTTPTPWTEHIDDASGLQGFARVLPLLSWGYHFDHERWLRACATWEQARVPLSNPAQVLAWNSDKRYLARLADIGIAIPSTTWSDHVIPEQVDAMFDATGAHELILKPSVSGGGWKTRRLRRGDVLDPMPSGISMLLQPYLPSIATHGETSLLFFGGRLSHVVNKLPVEGEFRVQEEFGGLYRLLESPPVRALALAEQVLAAIKEPLLYARIDTVPDADGHWLLMEAELIEPDFYLGMDPTQGAGFAMALRAAIDAD
jgi:hypothetical protein